MKIHNDQNGFAMIYGLIVLFAASLTGFSLMYLAGKDKVASVDYIKARTSSIAAQAALKACEHRFTNQSNIAVVILNKYSKDTTRKWFLSDSNKTNQEVKIKMDASQSNSPRFSVRIMAFDPRNGILQVEGIGYGMGEGKKSVIGIYQLNGTQIPPAAMPRHALYLGSGFGNCDNPLTIYGDVYTGNNSMINANSGDITVYGNLKTGVTSFATNARLTVNGNAYFRCNTKFQNSDSYINGSAGFTKNLDLNGSLIHNVGNFFINGNIIGTGSVRDSGGNFTTKYYTGGCFNSGRIINIDPVTKTGVTSPIDIAGQLGMTNADDSIITVRSDLEPYITSTGGTIYYPPSAAGIKFDTPGWNLVNAYATHSKWNGFLVVKVNYNSEFNINKNGGTFNDKIIWIIGGSVNYDLGNWYSSGPNSNTLIWLKDNAVLMNFGELGMTSFRGLIYGSSSNSLQQFIFKMKKGTFYGAIINASTNPTQFNQSGKDTIRYDQSIIDEFANLGVLSLPGGTVVDTSTVALNDTRIRPVLLGMTY